MYEFAKTRYDNLDDLVKPTVKNNFKRSRKLAMVTNTFLRLMVDSSIREGVPVSMDRVARVAPVEIKGILMRKLLGPKINGKREPIQDDFMFPEIKYWILHTKLYPLNENSPYLTGTKGIKLFASMITKMFDAQPKGEFYPIVHINTGNYERNNA